MYCPRCGEKLVDDAAFCPNCGMKIEVPGNYRQAQPTPSAPKKPKKKKGLIAAIIAGVLVIAGVLAYFLFFCGRL